MNRHTPGPWKVHQRPTPPREYGHHVIADSGLTVCSVTYQLPDKYGETERIANAHLMAAAPDHAMIASALCSGAARWEPFASDSGGEFCIGGLRHATNLDQFGVPVMTDGMRAAIAKATGVQS